MNKLLRLATSVNHPTACKGLRFENACDKYAETHQCVLKLLQVSQSCIEEVRESIRAGILLQGGYDDGDSVSNDIYDVSFEVMSISKTKSRAESLYRACETAQYSFKHDKLELAGLEKCFLKYYEYIEKHNIKEKKFDRI